MSTLAHVTARPARPHVPRMSGPCQRLLVKGHNNYVVVRVHDIVWAEAAANYIVLHTLHGNHVLRRTLRQLEDMLDPRYFFRTCRSAIVNLHYAREVQLARGRPQMLCLHDGVRVPMRCSLRLLQERLQVVA